MPCTLCSPLPEQSPDSSRQTYKPYPLWRPSSGCPSCSSELHCTHTLPYQERCRLHPTTLWCTFLRNPCTLPCTLCSPLPEQSPDSSRQTYKPYPLWRPSSGCPSCSSELHCTHTLPYQEHCRLRPTTLWCKVSCSKQPTDCYRRCHRRMLHLQADM